MVKNNEVKQEQLHKGHRERLKRRFREQGLDAFTDVQVLELLLFYAIPQRDTNEIAHMLLNRFGSIAGVLEASTDELETIPGIKTNGSTLLNFCAQLARRYEVSCQEVGLILDSVEKCCQYMVPYFVGHQKETVYLLCLDAKCQSRGCYEVTKGTLNAAVISVREIVETALTHKATSVVLAHNHPSGLAVPSAEDVITTRRVAMALDAVGVELVDHVVVADREAVSLRASNLYHPDECRAIV